MKSFYQSFSITAHRLNMWPATVFIVFLLFLPLASLGDVTVTVTPWGNPEVNPYPKDKKPKDIPDQYKGDEHPKIDPYRGNLGFDQKHQHWDDKTNTLTVDEADGSLTFSGHTVIRVPKDNQGNPDAGTLDHELSHDQLSAEEWNKNAETKIKDAIRQLKGKSFVGVGDNAQERYYNAFAQAYNKLKDAINNALQAIGQQIDEIGGEFDDLTGHGSGPTDDNHDLLNNDKAVKKIKEDRGWAKPDEQPLKKAGEEPAQPDEEQEEKSGADGNGSYFFDDSQQKLYFSEGQVLNTATNPSDTILGRGEVLIDPIILIGPQINGSVLLSDTKFQIIDINNGSILLKGFIFGVAYMESTLPSFAGMIQGYLDVPPAWAGGINNNIGSEFLAGMQAASKAGDRNHHPMVWFYANQEMFDGNGVSLIPETGVSGSLILGVAVLNSALAWGPKPGNMTVDVPFDTNLYWTPGCGAAYHNVYFGTDFNDVNDATTASAEFKGNRPLDVNHYTPSRLELGRTYYWRIDEVNNSNIWKGGIWEFTAETGKAYNLAPANSLQDIPVGIVNLAWKGAPGAVSFDVYFSNDQSLVADNNAHVRVAGSIIDSNFAVSAPLAAETYYWRVVTNFPPETNLPSVASDVWSFCTEPYLIVFNTSDVNDVNYDGHNIASLNCRVRDVNGWSPVVATGTVAADGVSIFDFNGFNYDRSYTIIVLPKYDNTFDNQPRRPLAIHVIGNFYFDGWMNISGDNAYCLTYQPMAYSGGFRGMMAGDYASNPEVIAGYFTGGHSSQYNRFNDDSNQQPYVVPTSSAYNIFGPGIGELIAPFDSGGGGGYGGIGGDSGRGYFYGMFTGGPAYGDKEVPVPFGGSAGGYGKELPSGAGGGGVEIVATGGSVTFGNNAKIYAEGGSVSNVALSYPSSGGAGGSVRIIADGNFVNMGIIDVNGGKGGCNDDKGEGAGGGGAGGRVSIYYGTAYSNTGQITVDGGEKGFCIDSMTDPNHNGLSLASDGQNGTIFVSSGSSRKASAPTPKSGEKMVYCPNSPAKLTLKWYSGYNVTSANDIVYFGQNPNPITQIGSPVPATRGHHSSTIDVNIYPNQTYYWKVVTNGTVSSDIWSFKTVNWRCPIPDVNAGTLGGPLWDSNRDCVVTDTDFWYFAKDWCINRADYTLDGPDLYRLANQWMDCQGRTDNGCTGW